MALVLAKVLVLLLGFICCVLPASAGGDDPGPPVPATIAVTASAICPRQVCAGQNTVLRARFNLQIQNPPNGRRVSCQTRIEIRDNTRRRNGFLESGRVHTLNPGGSIDQTSTPFFTVAYPESFIGRTINLDATITVSGGIAARGTNRCSFTVVRWVAGNTTDSTAPTTTPTTTPTTITDTASIPSSPPSPISSPSPSTDGPTDVPNPATNSTADTDGPTEFPNPATNSTA